MEHDNAWNGGVLSTAGGLVFQGQLSGEFSAYDAATGEELWSYNVKAGAASGPGTYAIDGEQYVTITTGWGSAFALAGGLGYTTPVPPTLGKVVTFKLGATGSIADPDIVMVERTPRSEDFGTPEALAEGVVHFQRYCATCHGELAISSSLALLRRVVPGALNTQQVSDFLSGDLGVAPGCRAPCRSGHRERPGQ